LAVVVAVKVLVEMALLRVPVAVAEDLLVVVAVCLLVAEDSNQI
jgi:hypothetical protein